MAGTNDSGTRRRPRGGRSRAARLRTALAGLVPSTRRGRLLLGLAAVLVAVVVGVALVVVPPLLDDGDEPSAAGTAPASTAPEQPGEDEPDEVAALTGVEGDARDVLMAWGRPDLTYDAWWAGLRGLLAPGARSDYQGTDPADLPDLDVEAVDGVRPGPSRDTATVFFTTSTGRFGVDMSRRSGGSAWLAVRVLFPGQESSLR